MALVCRACTTPSSLLLLPPLLLLVVDARAVTWIRPAAGVPWDTASGGVPASGDMITLEEWVLQQYAAVGAVSTGASKYTAIFHQNR
jgi:hypothetical protein